jgi:crossover junction endodeoxyribonuclease RusA
MTVATAQPSTDVTVRIVSVASFFIPGNPITQGSLRPFVINRLGRKPYAVVTADNKAALRSWRWLVASAVKDAFDRPLEGPVALTLRFYLPVPAGRQMKTPRQRAHWALPWRGLDLDKLERAILDALTGVAFRNDAQVCDVIKQKRFAEGSTGTEIIIEQLEVV